MTSTLRDDQGHGPPGLKWLHMEQPAFKKRLYAIAGGGAFLLLVLVWFFIKGGLSQRGFALGIIVVWVAMFLSLYGLITSWRRSAQDERKKQIASGIPAEVLDRDQAVRTIRSMKRLIAIFVCLLGLQLLETQGKPLLARTGALAFHLVVLASCVHSLVRSRKKLQSLDANLSTKPQL
jgi:hypothetical protein